MADVLNEHNPEKVLDTEHGKYQNSLLTDDDIKLSISNKISKNLKENFHNHKWKHNAILTVYHEKSTKKLDSFLVDNKPNVLMNMKWRCYQKPMQMFNQKIQKIF